MEIRKTVRLGGKIVFYIVFILIFLLVAGMMISKISNRVFFVGNRATIWVMTNSMEDQIPARSYILIRKVEDPAQIQAGDVITFYSDDPVLQGHLNTHRVVDITEDGSAFITKGDDNLGNDRYPARAESVVGIYEKNLTVLTAIGRVAQSKIGLLCIVILMVAWIAVSFAGDSLKKLWKQAAKDSPSDQQK